MRTRDLRRISALALLAASAAAGSAQASVPPLQTAVRVIEPATVHVHPSQHSRSLGRLRTYTPFTLSQLVLPEIGHIGDSHKGWVRVRLTRRPNGSTGWIPAYVTRQVEIPWRIVVSLGRRDAKVYRSGRIVRRMRVVVGKPGTPTPHGHFFVVEHVKLHVSWARGLWALALAAHSNVFNEFEGGDGQVAMHARGSLSGGLGTASSHGCIRLANGDAAWMARKIPNGTPVDVTRN